MLDSIALVKILAAVITALGEPKTSPGTPSGVTQLGMYDRTEDFIGGGALPQNISDPGQFQDLKASSWRGAARVWLATYGPVWNFPIMFIGHFGVGFASKFAAPKISLGTLFLAAQFVDLLWPSLLLLGIERVDINSSPAPLPLTFSYYPVSHSLVMALVWAGLFSGVHFALRRSWRGAWVLGLVVVSHWVLDWIVHVPDLAVYPGGPRVGLGLWLIPIGAQLAELFLFVAGVLLYLRVTRATDRVGRWALVLLLAFLFSIQVSNALGPPPPSVSAVAWVGQAQWLLVLWGYWVDRHRAERLPT